MIIEPADVAAVRLAESRALFPSPVDLARAGLEPDEYRRRIAQLVAAGVIRSFHLTLVVPPLMGGSWVWAAVLAQSDRPLESARHLVSRLPFVTEIVINASLPLGIGPNLALLFYSRDFETETRFIRSLTGLKQLEVFRIQEFSFPVSVSLSREEKSFIRFLMENAGLDSEAIAANFGQTVTWVQAKLERLFWTENNRTGVVRIQPTIDWTRVSNFGHFHFLVETSHRPEQLVKLLGDQGMGLVLGGREINGRYIGIEADIWGIARLMEQVEFLDRITGIRVAAILYNREVIINDEWVGRTIAV